MMDCREIQFFKWNIQAFNISDFFGWISAF